MVSKNIKTTDIFQERLKRHEVDGDSYLDQIVMGGEM